MTHTTQTTRKVKHAVRVQAEDIYTYLRLSGIPVPERGAFIGLDGANHMDDTLDDGHLVVQWTEEVIGET